MFEEYRNRTSLLFWKLFRFERVCVQNLKGESWMQYLHVSGAAPQGMQTGRAVLTTLRTHHLNVILHAISACCSPRLWASAPCTVPGCQPTEWRSGAYACCDQLDAAYCICKPHCRCAATATKRVVVGPSQTLFTLRRAGMFCRTPVCRQQRHRQAEQCLH